MSSTSTSTKLFRGEWDVRDGAVWRNGQRVTTFRNYQQANFASDLTVEQWENRKWALLSRVVSA